MAPAGCLRAAARAINVHLLRGATVHHMACTDAVVTGLMNLRKVTSASPSAPLKAASSDAGKWLSFGGGISRPFLRAHTSPATNVRRHHDRQRRTVCSLTPRLLRSTAA